MIAKAVKAPREAIDGGPGADPACGHERLQYRDGNLVAAAYSAFHTV